MLRTTARFRSARAIAAPALFAGLALAHSLAAAPAAADEGMWTLNGFPAARFEAEYGFVPDQAWLDLVRGSAVRFNNGGSGSFVSAGGLVITNHHVGADCIQKLSSAENDYLTDGFIAASPAEELACPDLELNVLESIERVTARVRGAAGAADPAKAAEARRAEMATIEKECQEATGLRCDVVTLYQGGEYDLYRYRRYDDVRLAFAPAGQLAFFGGDPDNFEYPRYNVDFALFRAYRDGAPAATPVHLAFHGAGPAEGEVAFVAGHPGSTGRYESLAALEWLRDVAYPMLLADLGHAHDLLLAFSARGEEQARIAQQDLHGVENSMKALSGYLSGLLDPELMAAKARQEAELRRRVAADPELAAGIGDPWAEIAGALDRQRAVFARSRALNTLGATELSSIARTVVRLTAELEKPGPERLREFRDTALPSVYQSLYSEAPIYPEYEEYRLTAALEKLSLQYGPVHPLVIEVLGEKSPAELARELVAGTKLADPAARRALVEGGVEAVRASEDPMIRFMLRLDGPMREMRKLLEDEIDAVETRASERIADAHFRIYGTDTYPDATFTLRLSYGRVGGYEEGGRQVPWTTGFAGLFERAEKRAFQPPWDVPPALLAARERLDLATAVNFVSAHDIIGGNSGSPVIDRQGRFVGLIFDGNLYMLPNRFLYRGVQSRAISVHPAAILATLRTIDPAAGWLADELEAGE